MSKDAVEELPHTPLLPSTRNGTNFPSDEIPYVAEHHAPLEQFVGGV